MESGSPPGLPAQLLRFIALAIPTYLAAEVLLFLAARPERAWRPEEIVVEMRPVVITLPAAKEYLALFLLRNIVEESDGCYFYKPSSPELEAAIGALAYAYNERPVTLIHTIYNIAESRIQSFADSFKFRKE
jgi:hypothetical protein